MAVDVDQAIKLRGDRFLSQPLQFRRQRGKIHPKKIQRKLKVKFIHILLSFLVISGIFLLIQQSYLFLISWDYLNVKGVKIVCQKASVKKDIQAFFGGLKLGNILLLNIDHLQGILEGHRWVADVSVRKLFPSSLKIEVQERSPVAALKKETYYLIDKEGILLEKINPQLKGEFPLLVDSNLFVKHYQEKLRLAWECLESLTPLERKKIDVLDLSDYENVVVRLKGSSTHLKLGADRFPEKLKSFHDWRPQLEGFEPLEYVDLRFQDRLYFKTRQSPDGSSFPALVRR